MVERGPLLQTGTVLLDGSDQEVASGGVLRRGIWHKLGLNGIKPTVAAAPRTGALSIPPWPQEEDVREEIGSNKPPRQSTTQNLRHALRYCLWSFVIASSKEGTSFVGICVVPQLQIVPGKASIPVCQNERLKGAREVLRSSTESKPWFTAFINFRNKTNI